jgi:hypothetical protein
VVTAHIPLATHKLTGVSVGSAATDSLNLGQAQAEAFIWCGTAGGSADAITLSPSPAITAYAAGQRFVWMASSSVNTGATTVAISGLSTIALQNNGAALVAGNHAASKMFIGILNTTSTVQIMQVQNSGTISNLTVSGTSLLTGVTTHGDDVVSDTDSTDDLGTTGVRWANLFVDGITATDQITATGFTGTLDGILGSGAAAAATVTQLTSGGNIVSDTDSTDSLGTTGVRWAGTWTDAINGVTSPTAQYTSAEETKLSGIEASADVTDATNVLAGLVGQEAVATGFTGTLDGILGSGTPAAATVTTIDASGVATATTFEPDGDTSAADNAAIGYTSDEGLILTGQGSTTDVTIKNDADATVFSIATGTTTGTFAGTVLAKTDTDTSNTGSVTLDFTANQNFILTFTGNVTLDNPTTEQVGQAGVIACIQDGTGSRTLSLGTDYETAAGGGITLSTAADAVDIIPYFVKAAGSIQLGAVQKAFS